MEKRIRTKRKLAESFGFIGRLIMFIIAAGIIVAIFPSKPSFKYEYAVNSYWKNNNLVSPFDFLIQKSKHELQNEKSYILQNKKIYFDIIDDDTWYDKELNSLSSDDKIIIIDGNFAYQKKVGDVIENIRYNKEKTEEALGSQFDDIVETKGLVRKGELIISKNEIIDEDKYQVLESLRAEYDKNISPINIRSNQIIGQFILTLIALVSMLFFFKEITTEIYQDIKKLVFILLLIILMAGITALIVNINPYYIYIVPLCITPIIIRTFFSARPSLYIFLVSIIIIGFSVPNSFEFVFYQVIVGMLAIISMESLENRAGFFRISVLVLISYSLIYLAITLAHDNDIKNIDYYKFGHFALNAFLTLFSFPLIYLFERMFGFVSEITLMEYSNANSKILKELSIKAPGTFQHSIQVANISEALVHEIGGNALLARVGALHHDIGKIMMPSFFIENQNTGFNPHNEISYEESAKIITDHVLDGVKIAHRFKLPEQIIDFIRTHHGTSKTRYFYNMHKLENPDMPMDEDVFTYMGPKPFTKETAVVMMVDSVEAASRSLKEHSEKSISDLVDNIIDQQISDDQFSNADITFRDIDTIKDFLKHRLQSIYHTRIEYPLNVNE